MERIAAARVTGAAFIDLIRTELQRSERQQTPSQRRSSQDHPQRLKREQEALAIFDKQSRSG
jgi:hypothetical protein